MSKHTPGPWHYGSYHIEADDGTLVCNMSGWRGSEKTKANTRLIAQAPRLLEALKVMVSVFEQMAGDCQDKEQAEVEEDAVRNAIAAIAAATEGDSHG